MKIFDFSRRRKKQPAYTSEKKGKEASCQKGDADGDGIFCFDRSMHRPVIRASICTGEQVAGFKDLKTGRFTEIMMIRDDRDMQEFLKKYGLSEDEIRREW